MSELNKLGEFGLIDLIKEGTIHDTGSVVVGIGDDSAVLLPTPRQLQLLTTDMLVESVHFDLATTTPWQLGYKAIAVNLSDIAAMGGIPRHAVISVALPQSTPAEFVVNLYKGMKEICREYGVNIVGGDTVSSPQGIVINVTVAGEVEPANLVRRSGAQPGDIVAVTGWLGNSAAGLELLNVNDWEEFDFAWPLVTSHLTPQPQVKLGQLVAAAGATSMDDISDGLASEAHEIAKASNVGIKVYAEQIPLAPELKEAAQVLRKPVLEYALYGGEDFQLVFTMESSNFAALLAAYPDLPLAKVGEVVDASQGVSLVDKTGYAEALEARGYNHFREAEEPPLSFETTSPEGTHTFGEILAGVLQPGDVLCLAGDLGAGKTLLTQGITAGLKVAGQVASPTFTVLNVYEGTTADGRDLPIYHFDLYRLEHPAELAEIGFDHYVDAGGIAIIEWPEKFAEFLPEKHLWLSLKQGESATGRVFELLPVGARYRELCEELKQVAHSCD
ncbi:thiamine-phosphate kinase [Sporomusa aerivorans]|uniref:thiamine-phosphate kinase n=1 Tax=Sporomusa aerivorans TaxID=204936 RepID=UPI00352BC99F